MKLKYGMNPNQEYAEFIDNDNLKVLNGNPSVINFMDALNSWQLVKEIDEYSNTPTAASFKHVTPSGVSIGNTVEKNEKLSYCYTKELISPLSKAYLKARGVDRLASFGDFIALSRTADLETAKMIRPEVSDGIIAPDFEDEALEILKSKKKGSYVIFQINNDYVPADIEERIVFGFKIKQHRNNLKISDSSLSNIVTENKDIPDSIKKDLIIGMITLKYTQSNSICAIHNGQVIGIGSGQQSRILCTELALKKANRWYQKTKLDHDKISFPAKASKTERDQIIELERERVFGDKIILKELDICLCSDGFYPQVDNIELANKYGVKYIAAPMGSIRDNEIIEKCNQYGIVFVNTGIRLFHH